MHAHNFQSNNDKITTKNKLTKLVLQYGLGFYIGFIMI